MADIRITILLIINITVCIIQAERNVAVGKSTTQSSTAHGGVSSRAVDGDTNSNYSMNSCTHTDLGSPSWWCVDLVERINIETMEIYTRDSDKLQGFEIRLSSTDSCDATGFQSADLCYKDTTTTPQDVYTIEQCNQTSSTSFNGRSVFISVEGPADKTVLTLCEVNIYEECSIQCKDGNCNQDGVCNSCNIGRYGDYCNNTCSDGCLSTGGCIQSSGVCNGCNNGWHGDYCNNTCSDGCLSTGGCIQSSGVCNGCNNGRYGDYCNEACSHGCLSTGGCIQSSGVCNGCNNGWHGDYCNTACSGGCLNNECRELDGVCNTCKPEIVGDYCNNTCSDGCFSYGSPASCGRNGKCFHGCINGRSGNQCVINCKQYCNKCQRNDANSCVSCPDGRFGESCDELCDINCKSATQTSGPVCDITSGLCTLGCRDGFYDDTCKTACSPGCQDNICGQRNGSCSNGCVAGKTEDNCITDCRDGWYGVNCSNICGQCADDVTCDKSTGSCGLVGCQAGYSGPKCQTDDTGTSALSNEVSGIIGALSTAVLLLSCITIYCIYRKRKSTNDSATPDARQIQPRIQYVGGREDPTLTPERPPHVYINQPTPTIDENKHELL